MLRDLPSISCSSKQVQLAHPSLDQLTTRKRNNLNPVTANSLLVRPSPTLPRRQRTLPRNTKCIIPGTIVSMAGTLAQAQALLILRLLILPTRNSLVRRHCSMDSLIRVRSAMKAVMIARYGREREGRLRIEELRKLRCINVVDSPRLELNLNWSLHPTPDTKYEKVGLADQFVFIVKLDR